MKKRNRFRLLTRNDFRLHSTRRDAVSEVYIPAPLLPIDGHGNFGYDRGMFASFLEDDVAWPELGNR